MKRRHYRIRVKHGLLSALVASASAASVPLAAEPPPVKTPPVAPNEFVSIVAGHAKASGRTRGLGIISDKKTKEELESATSCVVPGRLGGTVFSVKGRHAGLFLQAYRLAEAMPGFNGWSNETIAKAAAMITCQTNGGSAKERNNIAGWYNLDAAMAFVAKIKGARQGADTIFHERTHDLFWQKNRPLYNAYAKEGGDEIVIMMLDESNAFARTELSFFIDDFRNRDRKQKESGSGGGEGSGDGSGDGEARGFIDRLAFLIGERDIRQSLEKTGALPPLINRLVLMQKIGDLVSRRAYSAAAASALARHGNNTVTIGDAKIGVLMGYDGLFYERFDGLTEYLKAAHPFLQFEHAATFKKGIAQRANSYKNGMGTLEKLVAFLDQAASAQVCTFDSWQYTIPLLIMEIKFDPLFKAHFIRQDMLTLYKLAHERLREKLDPLMGSEEEKARYSAISGVMTHVLDSIFHDTLPEPRVLRDHMERLRGTTSRIAATCG